MKLIKTWSLVSVFEEGEDRTDEWYNDPCIIEYDDDTEEQIENCTPATSMTLTFSTYGSYTFVWTGIEKQYFATNKEDQKEESFNSKVLRDVSVKSGTHTSPTDKLTDSKFPEIIKNIALIYVDLGDNDKALEAMLLARSENPDNVNLLLTEANVHYKMGNVEKFKELLEMATQMDPNNAELQYNLGVVSAESNDIENATKYYQNAIELKPDYTNAYINLAALILGQEEGILSQMNALGSSASDDRKYDQLKAERNQLYLDAIPYLEKAIGIDSTNFQAAKTLSNIYSATGNTEKFKEFKALAESLEE